MEISSIAGLPAHPLVVHGAVVLVPLAAVALVAMGWRKQWRAHYALPVAVIAWAGWFMAQLASGSGEALEHDLRGAARAAGQNVRFGDHPELGETAAFIALLLAITATALWAVDRWGARFRLPSWTATAAYGAGCLAAVAATAWMVQAGHTGAELAWDTNAGVAALLK
ncbi:MAG: DUF2231 domain-containing protein [Dehalococcoidia bacterium]